MSQWRVAIEDRDGNGVMTSLQVTPETLSWGQGGPLMALLPVQGDADLRWEIRNWLGHSVTVFNPTGMAIWWGQVVESRIAQGTLQFVYSLENMHNRVAVAYTTGSDRGTTDWAENDRSVERYGRKELLFSRSDMSLAQAEAERDRILDDTAFPVPEVRSGGGVSMLRCKGDWLTLDWLRYEDETGRIVFDNVTETAEQLVGWGLVASDIGFTRDGNIHSGTGKMANLIDGTAVEIVGPTNAGTKTIDGSVSDQVVRTYTASTISFEPNDDLLDSANGLGFIKSGTLINITGSASNSGWHLSKTEKGPERIEISPGFSSIFSSESAGPSVSIQTSHAIPVSQTLTDEAPGTSTTITAHGEQIVQGFQIEGTDTWTLGEVVIRAKKIGNPGDYLKVGLYEDGDATLLDSDQVVGDELTTETADVTFTLANTQTLAAATTYNLVISRSGSNDTDNCYVVEVDEGTNYADGAFQVWTGTAWTTRATNADMPFECWGNLDTGTQMQRIATAFNTSRPTFDAISSRVTTGIESRQYRDGDKSALAEIEALLAGGTSTGGRLRAKVTWERTLIIEEAPESTEPAAIWNDFGILTDLQGERLAPGVLPHQQWVRIAGAPTTDGDVAASSPVYFEEVELHVSSGRITPTTAGGSDLWKFGGVRQG